jgi:FMN reductase
MTAQPKPLRALGISGSPSANSRSRILVERTLARLEELQVATELLDLSELPGDALLARQRDPSVDAAVQQAATANILILGTPVYRASLAGQLKAFFDLFPQDALRGVVAGLIATGAGPAHALVLDHALRPLIASLRGLSAAQALYVVDGQFPDKTQIPSAIEEQTGALAAELYALGSALVRRSE